MVRRSKITIILLLPTAVAIFLIGLIIQSVGSHSYKPKVNRVVAPSDDGVHLTIRQLEEINQQQ